MRVRRATVDDARAIAEAHVLSWQTAYRGIVPDGVLDALSIEQRTDAWHGSLPSPDQDVWVAEVDGRVVGFSNDGATRDEDLPPDAGELYAIYLDPGAWGSGAGEALFRAARRGLRLRGYAIGTLWTMKENARAQAFYEKMGWSRDGGEKSDDRGSWILREVRYRGEL